jgi:uncharacterized protein YycO
MKLKISFLSVFLILLIFGFYFLTSAFFSDKTPSLKSGDIIFQSSQSGQANAVQLATHSVYSHCGIIFIDKGAIMVYEAVQPVKTTPFKAWIKHGKDEKYVVRRLKNASTVLTPAIIAKMKKVGDSFLDKNYDICFGWSDSKIYCSELVWKIYKNGADIEVGKLQKLKDFDLSNKLVKETLKERYGDHIPLEETVISPQNIFKSELLETVEE